MKFIDWRIRAGIILILMIVLFIVGQFVVFDKYIDSAQRQTDNAAMAVTNYIDTFIDNAYELVKEFTLNDNFDNESTKRFLANCVEKTSGVQNIVYFFNDGRMISYEELDEKTYKETLEIYNEIISTDGVYTKIHKASDEIHVGKKITNIMGNNSVIVAYIDMRQIESNIDSLNLLANKIKVEVYDIYGANVYTNYEYADKDNSLEENDYEGLSSSYEENIIKMIINSIKNVFALLLKGNSKTNVSSMETSKYALFRVNAYANVSDMSNYFSTRLTTVVAAFAVLIFVVAILVLFAKKNIHRTKLYVTTLAILELIVICFFITELSVNNALTDREVGQLAHYVYQNVKEINNLQNNNGELINILLKDNFKKMNIDYAITTRNMNDFMYVMNKTNKYIQGLYILKNGNVVYEYPNHDEEIQTIINKRNGNYDTIYNDKNYVKLYVLDDNHELAIKYHNPDYVTYFKNSGIITNHVFNEEIPDKNALYESEKDSDALITINNKLKVSKNFKQKKYIGTIYIFDSEDNVYNVYDYEFNNDFGFILLVGILIGFGEIGLVALTAFVVKFREQKKIKYEEDVKKDMILLDKLLKKINDDISEINKSFHEEDGAILTEDYDEE